MKTEHPITPPPDLIQQWWDGTHGAFYEFEAIQQWWDGTHGAFYEFEAIATQAARWGADQELEACCSWADATGWYGAGDMLRTARRSKPSSLKEQALAELDLLKADATVHGLGFDAAAIRRALEALPDV